MNADLPHMVPKMGEASPEPSPRRTRDDDDGDLEIGEPQRKRRRTTRSSAFPVPSSMDKGKPRAVGPDDAVSEDAS